VTGNMQEYANLYKHCIQKLKIFMCQDTKEAGHEVSVNTVKNLFYVLI